MANRFLYSSFVFLLALLCTGTAAAQSCDSPYQLIFDLRDPQIGSYNVWDTVYGTQDQDEYFIDAAPVGWSGHHVAVGQRAIPRSPNIEILLTRLDYRGRIEWERAHIMQDITDIFALLPVAKGYMVAANKKETPKNSVLWIGFFDQEGRFLSAKEVRHPHGHLVGQSLLAANDGQGYLVAAGFEDPAGEINPHAIIYRLNEKGDAMAHHAYRPGLKNGILSLQPAEDRRGYIASGYIYDENARKTGWILSLNEDSSIGWQQQYPRGAAAQIESIKSYQKNYLVAAGGTKPFGQGYDAGWVMMLDRNSGEVLWQRYYRGNMHYQGRDLLVSDDGLISVMLNGKVPPHQGDDDENAGTATGSSGYLDYVRLLTLNPRGDLLFGDSYFNGKSAQARRMWHGNGSQRIMVGATRSAYQIENEGDKAPAIKTSMDGWMVSAVGAEPYKDPCAMHTP